VVGAAHGEVEVEGADAEALRGGGVGGDAAEVGADAGDEFADAEGLGDVVIGAEVEAGDAVVFGVEAGEDEDGEGGGFAELTEDVEAVDVGEDDVEEEEGGRWVGLGEGEGFGAGGGFGDAPAGALQGEPDEAAESGIIVGDEDGVGGDGWSRSIRLRRWWVGWLVLGGLGGR